MNRTTKSIFGILIAIIILQFIENFRYQSLLSRVISKVSNTATPKTKSIPPITPTPSVFSEITRPLEPEVNPAIVPPPEEKYSLVFSDKLGETISLSHYEFLTKGKGAFHHVLKGNNLTLEPAESGLCGEVVLLKDSFLTPNFSEYIVEGDGKIDIHNTHADFGILFRGTKSGSYYTFLWNGNPENNPPHWQVAKFDRGPSNFSYPGGTFGGGQSVPVYKPGDWVHFKVICKGDHFWCFVNLFDGKGNHLVFEIKDSSFASGTVGFHADFIQLPNKAYFRNLNVSVPALRNLE